MAEHTASKPIWAYLKLFFGPAVLLTLLSFWVAYQFVDPAPPSELTIATGSESGAYYHVAQRYRDILARDDVTLHIRTTAGSTQNLSLLEAQEPTVEVAFVQGGIGDAEANPELVSLASLYFEPLWVFFQQHPSIVGLADLGQKRIAVGAQGSGTRPIALQLLQDNGIGDEQAELLPLGGQEAVDALVAGEVDAVFLVASPQSEAVQTLLTAEDIGLLNFRRADAYSRFHPYVSSVRLPEGAINLEANIPPQDVMLLAPTANLVANPTLHPALQDLLLFAAEEVHGRGGLFEERGQFPSSKYLDFPLSKEAARYFESGRPFLLRYLPFWAASLVDRLKVMLLPLVALLIPLGRLLPPIYRWQVRSRIYRWYKELLVINPKLQESLADAQCERYLQELERIEDEVAKLSVPLSYAQELYNLRVHIQLVRDQVQRAASKS